MYLHYSVKHNPDLLLSVKPENQEAFEAIVQDAN